MSIQWAPPRLHVNPLHLRGSSPGRARLTARRFERAFAAATPATGRRLADIIATVSEPACLVKRIDGLQVGHWQSASWGRVRAITLLFDASGTCVGPLGNAGLVRRG